MSYVTSLTAIFLAFVALEDAPNLLKPTHKAESWRFEQTDGGKGEMKVDGDAIKFIVKEIDGTDWHVQAVQTDLDLKEGKEYTLKFKAKASVDRSIGVQAMIDQEDWHQIGLGDTAYLGKEYKEQSFTFTASSVVAKKNRISIVMGTDKGDVWIKEMTLTEKK
jgi:Carbohydrate binding domain